MKKYLKAIIILASIVLALIAVLTTYLYIDAYSELNRISLKRELKKQKEITQMETSFQKRPNMDDACMLMSAYYNKKDYQKALHYGNTCLELGANDTGAGFWVNYLIAKIYKETNKYDLAKKYLKIAIALDKDNNIKKYDWIERDNMHDII